MPPINEPIDFADLPDNIGQLKAIIWRLAFQKNAIIKARDEHINTLLDQNQSLECSLQLCRESLAAAEAGSPPASASEGSESEDGGSVALSSPLSSPLPSSSSEGDLELFSDLDDDESDGGMGPGALVDQDNDNATASDSDAGSVPDPADDESASEMGREASPDLNEEGSGSEAEPRTSPTSSIRSRTSVSSRVSKKQKRVRSKGKARAQPIGKAGRRRVWSYSGGEIDLTDVLGGV